MKMPRSDFRILDVTDEYIYLVDLDRDSVSVTNDAEAVVSYLDQNFDLNTRQVFYRDSMGRIDELWHEDGRFRGYAPQDQDAIRTRLGIPNR